MSRKAFVEGVKALGYPCDDPRVMRSVSEAEMPSLLGPASWEESGRNVRFSLLDRNFDGEARNPSCKQEF